MNSYNIMIKPASSLCNMKCKYCFYDDVSNMRECPSSGIMTHETMEAIISNIKKGLKEGDRVSFLFQGGEPTLAGLSFFKEFVLSVSKWNNIKVSYALQTNGILIDDDWCKFLKENNFLVGISFDILPEAHDFVRIDKKNEGTYKKVSDTIRLLKKHNVDFNVLCTLTNSIAKHPVKVWNQLIKTQIDYVQFTPCLGELEDNISNPYALTPERFSSFYIALFPLWFEEYKKGRYISVKFFDDIVNLMILGYPTSCGMDGICRPQMVIESDGSVYPCDFYCLDEYKIGNIKENSITQILFSDKIGEFINRYSEKPVLCKECEYRKFCNSNCIRMRNEMCCKVDGSFCGYREFLKKYGTVLSALADKFRYKR